MNITGINTHIPSPNQLHKVVQLGLKHVRIDINWEIVEPQQGIYNFDALDSAVNYAIKNKLKVFATIAYSPSWQGGRTAVPNTQEWSLFVTMMVRRYKGKIEAYGMWNEPNLPGFWSGTIQQYLNVILVPGWKAVKREHSSALVVAPDLATIGSQWPTWLDAMAEYKNAFDVLAIHNYEDTPAKMETTFYQGGWKPLQLFIPKYRPIKQYIDKVGKPTWLCEMGWTSNRFGIDGQFARYKDFITSATLPVDRIYAYELQDDNNVEDRWGLYYADGTAKLATQAFTNG